MKLKYTGTKLNEASIGATIQQARKNHAYKQAVKDQERIAKDDLKKCFETAVKNANIYLGKIVVTKNGNIPTLGKMAWEVTKGGTQAQLKPHAGVVCSARIITEETTGRMKLQYCACGNDWKAPTGARESGFYVFDENDELTGDVDATHVAAILTSMIPHIDHDKIVCEKIPLGENLNEGIADAINNILTKGARNRQEVRDARDAGARMGEMIEKAKPIAQEIVEKLTGSGLIADTSINNNVGVFINVKVPHDYLFKVDATAAKFLGKYEMSLTNGVMTDIFGAQVKLPDGSNANHMLAKATLTIQDSIANGAKVEQPEEEPAEETPAEEPADTQPEAQPQEAPQEQPQEASAEQPAETPVANPAAIIGEAPTEPIDSKLLGDLQKALQDNGIDTSDLVNVANTEDGRRVLVATDKLKKLGSELKTVFKTDPKRSKNATSRIVTAKPSQVPNTQQSQFANQGMEPMM